METYKESLARLKEIKSEARRRKLMGVPLMLIGTALFIIPIEVNFPSGYKWCDQALGSLAGR